MFTPPLLLLADATAATTRLGTASGPDLTRYFVVLGILLAAILGLAFGFKRLFANALRAKSAARQLAIVDLLPLGGKQRLAVVRCYDRTFALGLGEKEIALIAEIDPVHVAGRTGAAPSAADQSGFARLLQRARGDQSAPAEPAGNNGPQAANAAGTPRDSRTIGDRIRRALGAEGVLG